MVKASKKIDAAWKIIKDLTDPELPFLTLEDLGVINQIEACESGKLLISITPTYIGCPALSVIEEKIKRTLKISGYESELKRLFSPAWTTNLITDQGKRKMKEFGIAPPLLKEERRSSDACIKTIECPLCNATKTEKVSDFGSTACKSLYRCKECLEPFDYFKCI